jgi:uncharacterized phiE125 gp8 family phage protein
MKLSIQTYKVLTQAQTEPVSVDDVKIALRINCDDDDALIETYITAAREMVETATSRDLIEKTYNLYMDGFSDSDYVLDRYSLSSIVDIVRVPVTAITSVEYIASDTINGNYTVLPPENYQTDIISQPARIYFEKLPKYKSKTLNAIKITFKSGYISDNIPQPLVQAIMLIVGHWYENRQDVVTGTQVNSVPETSKWLIDRYRLQLFR